MESNTCTSTLIPNQNLHKALSKLDDALTADKLRIQQPRSLKALTFLYATALRVRATFKGKTVHVHAYGYRLDLDDTICLTLPNSASLNLTERFGG